MPTGVSLFGYVGATGPPGPTGPAGAGGDPLIYTLVGVSSFYQAHSFDFPPEVRLIDNSDSLVLIAVDYPDVSHVSISFPTPFTGRVVLS